MSQLAEELAHLKNHVEYPTDQAGVVKACNNMADVNEADRSWFVQALPDGTYESADEVMSALLSRL